MRGPDFSIGHGQSTNFGPVAGVPRHLLAAHVNSVPGHEKVAIDGDLQPIAVSNVADGHQGRFPRPLAVRVSAGGGDADVNGWLREIDGKDVQVQRRIFADFVGVGDAGDGAGGRRASGGT